MRIHEILETCVEYVAIDGVLGSDPDDVIRYLQKSDPSLDEEFFAHIFTLLSSHPSIQLIHTAHPLPSSEGQVLLGTAPLPSDYDVQAELQDNVTAEDLYNQGVRGRQLAYHLAGREFRTDKQAMEDIKRAKEEKARRRRDGREDYDAGPSTPVRHEDVGEDLMTFIEDDDGGQDEDGVLRSDFRRLREKWGSRLRIRAIDDEIYYRLVGTHQRTSKITPIVFHVLQLAAKSREKGLTAIELGPAVGTSQGSLFYIMKVLGQLGLCAKVPCAIHGAVTNLLLFHRYLELNPSYRAMKRLRPLGEPENEEPKDAYAFDLGGVDNAVDDDLDDDDPLDDAVSKPEPEWTIEFGPITERELMAGHIVKERLLKLLDNPNLKNHLLKRKNLLSLIGWQGVSVLRHRRAVSRHIDILAHEGVIENVEVGVKRINCLRLTKYNPDFQQNMEQKAAAQAAASAEAEAAALIPDHELIVANTEPYAHQGNSASTVAIDHQINQLVAAAGTTGMTMADIRDNLDFYFKRMVEYHFVRSDVAFIPPHLRRLQTATTMESHGRERRLRAFSVSAFRELMFSQGIPVDDSQHPALTSEAGRWADLRSRPLYKSNANLQKALDAWAVGNQKALVPKEYKPRKVDPARTSVFKVGALAKKSGLPDHPIAIDDSGSEITEEHALPKRAMKYTQALQSRGRPRKYIHVVNEDGKVNRHIIGQIYPIPELSPIYVYVQKANKLVEAPVGYLGLGAPPPLSAEAIKKAHTPSWFNKFRRADKAAGNGNLDEDDGEGGTGAKKGRKRKGGASSDGKHEVQARSSKRSKKKATPVVDSREDSQEVDELEYESIAPSIPAEPEPITPKIAKHSEISRVSSSPDVTRPQLDQDHTGPQSGSDSNFLTHVPTPPLSANHPHPPQPLVRRPSLPPTTPAEGSSMGQKRKAHSPLTQPTPSNSSPAIVDQVAASVGDMSPKQATKRQKGRRTDGFSTVPSVPIESDRSDDAVLLPKPKGRKKQAAPSSSAGQANDTVSLGDLSTTTTPRQLSPMIGEDFQKDTPIFEMPDQTEPKELGFWLPTSMQRFKKRLDKQREASSQLSSGVSSPVAPTQSNADQGAFEGVTSPIALPAIPEGATSVVPHEIPIPRTDPTRPPAFPPTSVTITQPPNPKTPSTPAPLPATLARPKGLLGALDARHEGSPLTEITPKQEPGQHISAPLSSQSTRRLELGHIRRCNELCQTLRDVGGAMVDSKLKTENYEWAKRVAGTAAPFAPAIASQMDRLVFRRSVASLKNEGRLKETTAMVPTPTGRWVRAVVLYLPDISQEALQAYIRDLGRIMTAALTPRRVPRSKIAAAEYTEIRLTDSAKGKENAPTNTTPSRAVAISTRLYDNPEISAEDRRHALLKDINVVSSLYGHEGGRCARASTFHRAIIKAIQRAPDSPGVVSSSPQIFALPLLFTELAVSDWFKCIVTDRHDEKLEKFLLEPETKKTPLKDLPAELRPPRGFGGHKSKTKLVTLLNILIDLKLVAALEVTDNEAEASAICEDKATRSRIFYKVTENVAEAMHFRIYEFAPVYHVAADASGFLGVLPVNNTEQLDTFWKALQLACTRDDINSLPRLQHSSPDSSLIAPLTDLLDMKLDQKKLLRGRIRWSPEVRLLEVQKTALDGVVDTRSGQSKINTDEEINAFAWEYALPRQTVLDQLEARKVGGKARYQRKTAHRRDRIAEKAEQEERRKRAEADLQQKIAELRAAGKADWLDKVKRAAERNGLEYNQELDAWLGRYSMQVLSRRGPPTDTTMDEACKLFIRAKRNGESAPTEHPRELTIRKAPLSKKVRKDKKTRPPREPRDPNVPQVRRRHDWTHEEDEMLLDCEAIVRARSRNKLGNKGRAALHQVFPEFTNQVLLNRLKKLFSMPGKQPYFERLVDMWYETWIEHRGTETLPDEHPDSMTEFDLAAHMAFLRAKLPKQNIRLSAITGVRAKQERKTVDLPSDVAVFLENRKWNYQSVTVPSLEAVWEYGGGDDLRCAALAHVPLTIDWKPTVQPTRDGEDELEMGKLKSVLKMIVGASSLDYHEPAATDLIGHFANSDITRCTAELVEEKVFRRHKGAMDGRVYQFAGPWLQSTDPLYPDELYADAEDLPHKFDTAPGNKLNWPLIGKTGHMASLMNMVSNHEVDFDFDVQSFPTIKYQPDSYNTRRLNDRDFEYDVSVTRCAKGDPAQRADLPSLNQRRDPVTWEWISAGMDDTLVTSIVNLAKNAGNVGMTREDIQEKINISTDDLLAILAEISAQRPSSVFWAGYDGPRLVHVDYWTDWTVPTRSAIRDDISLVVGTVDVTQTQRSLPRRWTDVYGERDEVIWDRSVKNALAIIVSRPGLTERTLKGKLEGVHDRLESVELLQYLLDRGLVRREPLRHEVRLPPVEATEEKEEELVGWWPQSRVLWS